MDAKRRFMSSVLTAREHDGDVDGWHFSGADERHDYEVAMKGGVQSVIEAKGCLDGNNTNIYERPPQAEEFIIWSLCQNPGADPRHNAWSGIHTRLGAEIVARRQLVDGLVIWDMLCGTAGRPCPKTELDPARAVELFGWGFVPPPCIYLFPRTVPDARNNPNPKSWTLDEKPLLKALVDRFGGNESEVFGVRIETRMEGSEVQRKTRLFVGGELIRESRWTTLKRAKR
jgi:hypothetical protein